jgi:glycogen synthase
MRHHPDSHELDDWHLYGPRNPKIVEFVSRLAYEKGLRVSEIETVIEKALQQHLLVLEASGRQEG